MLHSKIIKCPEDKDAIGAAVQPLAEMAMDYSIELGIGTGLFDVTGFVLGWMKGENHVLGFYTSEDELVGMLMGITQYHPFTNIKILLVQAAYIRREHRKAGAKHVLDAFAAGRAYAKEIGADTLRIHIEQRMLPVMIEQGGANIYTGVEFTI